ncbi:Aste57867_15248 [Aphanomyces stellatus]|uniref:Aste57867_15248 protein n=1 Tax=Aphanomyces stellatus TaxID=120398 RepID=A0A485L2Z0_9STRA|nr:hypothetical protein As57867_015192 [Aphanomyces stellatus]VFT92057.1 Aste57867_15248 [Aphanomyces stellatus]
MGFHERPRSDAFTHSRVVWLGLAYTCLDSDVLLIGLARPDMPRLTRLSFPGLKLGDIACRRLAEMLTKWTYLDLTSNELTDMAAVPLARTLSASQTLRTLNMDSNQGLTLVPLATPLRVEMCT